MTDLVPSSRTLPAHRAPAPGAGALHQRAALPTPVKPPVKPAVAQSAPATSIATAPRPKIIERLSKAKQVEQSSVIRKFASIGNLGQKPLQISPAEDSEPMPPRVTPQIIMPQAPVAIETPTPQTAPLPELPKIAATQHASLSTLVPPPTPEPKTAIVPIPERPRIEMTPAHSRVLATAAAIALMGGYIWMQNSPKLAIQNAGNKAGISASLPSYVPSSYNLTHTNTAPGLVTLNFTSPGITETLKISQHRTSWDSSSLLDNYVAKAADAYAAVQGQGLTIYLFHNNQATWVNHGIWYSVEGTARLSREQILKIAYSL